MQGKNLQAIFDTVLDFRRAATVLEVHDVLLKCAGKYGVEFALAGVIPDKEVTKNEMLALLMIGEWPAEWSERYFEHHYIRYDPTIQYCRQNVTPIAWNDVPTNNRLATRVMNEVVEFGMEGGLTIPLLSPGGVRMAASFGGREVDVSENAQRDILFLANYASHRVLEIIGAPKPARPLTHRERECLAWAAMGKTNSDIGQILSISDRTVEKMLQNARNKFDAINTTQAVAIALNYGIL